MTITPSNDIVGHAANIPFDITLNKGQTYSAKASSQAGSLHLHYSQVVSNNPIAITIKDDLLELFNPQLHANIGGDQIFPVNMLGTKYIAIKGQLNGSFETLYIFATEDNTNISINGNNVANLNTGQTYVTYVMTSATAFIDASKPISVLQVSGLGNEVSIEVLPHIECTGSKEVAFVRSTSDLLFLNILVPTGSENAFSFNGSTSVIQASAFATVPSTGNQWKFAQIPISNSQLGADQSARIKNNNAYFHASILHGDPLKDARFGYISNINNASFDIVDTTFCQGSLTLPGGTIVTAPGTYEEIYQTQNICDSIVTY